jgi:hypothetical protein
MGFRLLLGGLVGLIVLLSAGSAAGQRRLALFDLPVPQISSTMSMETYKRIAPLARPLLLKRLDTVHARRVELRLLQARYLRPHLSFDRLVSTEVSYAHRFEQSLGSRRVPSFYERYYDRW